MRNLSKAFIMLFALLVSVTFFSCNPNPGNGGDNGGDNPPSGTGGGY